MINKLYNPVLLKELKLRFRFFKSITGMMFYLVALSIFVIGFLNIVLSIYDSKYFLPDQSFVLFILISVIQMGLVIFITPGLTAGAISAEREKQTLNMLLLTTQSSTSIILGKLLSSVAYLGLLLVAALPIYSIVFIYGGISPTQFITVFFFYFVTMIALGSVGIYFSTVLKKTITSMISTYSFMIFITIMTAFFFLISVTILNTTIMDSEAIRPFMYLWLSLNPGSLILSILSPEIQYGIEEITNIGLPIWIPYLIIYTLITVFSLISAIKKLRVNMKKR